MNQKATIIIKNETRDLMKKVARKEQTYDDLILELIQFKHNRKENHS